VSDIKRNKIETEEDWIDSPKYNNSIRYLIEKKYPDGAPDDVIAKVMLMTEEEVEEIYQLCIKKLRKSLT